MTTTVTLPADLADRIDAVRKRDGYASIDEAALALLTAGLAIAADDDSGIDPAALQILVDEGLASGPSKPWDMAEVRAEIRRRHPA